MTASFVRRPEGLTEGPWCAWFAAHTAGPGVHAQLSEQLAGLFERSVRWRVDGETVFADFAGGGAITSPLAGALLAERFRDAKLEPQLGFLPSGKEFDAAAAILADRIRAEHDRRQREADAERAHQVERRSEDAATAEKRAALLRELSALDQAAPVEQPPARGWSWTRGRP
jgi:hypothetical protein